MTMACCSQPCKCGGEGACCQRVCLEEAIGKHLCSICPDLGKGLTFGKFGVLKVKEPPFGTLKYLRTRKRRRTSGGEFLYERYEIELVTCKPICEIAECLRGISCFRANTPQGRVVRAVLIGRPTTTRGEAPSFFYTTKLEFEIKLIVCRNCCNDYL